MKFYVKFLIKFMIVVMTQIFLMIYFSYKYDFTEIGDELEYFDVQSVYTFIDPDLAYQILIRLDEFEPFGDEYYNSMRSQRPSFNIPHLGLIQDDEYCQKVWDYVVNNADIIFTEQHYFTEYSYRSLIRKNVIRELGVDSHPRIHNEMPRKDKTSRSIYLKPSINVFYVNSGLHAYQQIGKHFACTPQMYNRVPGEGSLSRKDLVNEVIYSYEKQYLDRPQCFSHNKFFPQSWLLRNEEQCRDFFENYFNTEEYIKLKNEQKIVYIRKIGFGEHKAAGVQPVTEEEEASIREKYDNGKACGEVQENYVIQKFIHNPLLVQNHKFDFRVYMLIASSNPLIAFYHDGFLRVSLHEYDPNSTNKAVLLTNTELAKDLFEKAAKGELVYGMNETELRNFQMWNLTRLQDYLLAERKIDDPDWLENYLRPEFKKAMIHLLRASSEPFLKRSSLYELFGVDFMLDDDLNLWFLECNVSPMLEGTSQEKEIFLTKMLKDQFEIIFALLRARMKRIIQLVNKISTTVAKYDRITGQLELPNIDNLKRLFKKATLNKFDDEFPISQKNGFQKIIDENLEGTSRYANLLEAECL